MKLPYLVGEKIYLRPVDKSDAPAITPWFNDAEVRRTILSWRPRTIAFEEAFLERAGQSESDLVLGIARRDDDALVGITGLHDVDPRHRHATYGIAIGAAADRGCGFGSEACRLMMQLAFDTANLHRVQLEVHADNAAGIRVYEKAGFVREGVLRRRLFRDGAYLDVIVMGILADEWRAAQPR